jgi:hypothetical protein
MAKSQSGSELADTLRLDVHFGDSAWKNLSTDYNFIEEQKQVKQV